MPDCPAGQPAVGVSVVICTKDRPDDLARAIASVRASFGTARTVEIVVVEEGEHPRPIPDVLYVLLPRAHHGFGYARNVGIRQARGQIVSFIDDDCEAAPGWLDSLLAPFQREPRILGVAGAVLVRDCGLVGYAENILGFPGGGLRYRHDAQGRVVPTRRLSTCNCAYRREAVLSAGEFPEEACLGGEDFLLAERVAKLGPCVYAPAAIVYHRPRGRLAAVFSWFVRRGRSEIGMLQATAHRKDLVTFLLRSSWTLRLFAVLLILARWPVLTAYLPVGIVFYYGAILWRFRFALRYPTHRRAWWLVPVVKFVMDLGTEFGRWRQILGGGRA